MKNKAEPKPKNSTKPGKVQGIVKPKKLQKTKMNPVLRDKKLLKEIGVKSTQDTSLDPFFVEGLPIIQQKSDNIEDEIREDEIILAPEHSSVDQDVPGLYFWSTCSANLKEKLPTVQNFTHGLDMYGWSDKWSDSKITCRCIQCEYKNTIPSMKGCKYVLMVDLDNIGVDFFLQTASKKDYLNDGFLWCFYGGGFRKHLDQKNKNIFDVLEKNDKSTCDDLLGTVFEKYKLENHLRFTVCGWNNQATDKSILKTLSLFVERVHCVILSKDKEFIKSAKAIIKKQASVAILAKSGNMEDEMKTMAKWVKETCK